MHYIYKIAVWKCLGLFLHNTWCKVALQSDQDLWILPWYEQFNKKKEIKQEYPNSSTAIGPSATRSGRNMHIPLGTDVCSTRKHFCSCGGTS